MSRPVVVLVTGEPIPLVKAERGGYAEMIRTAAGDAWAGGWATVDLRDGVALPALESVAAIVITGSSASVADREAWVLRGEEYLRGVVAAGVPTFGICFGHQMLGQALGGSVTRNPRGREIGTVPLTVVAEDDPVVSALGVSPSVNATHVDTVAELPPGARVLATTALEPSAAVRFAPRVWGVQFHPEMDATVIRAYLSARREIIAREGQDPDALLAASGEGLAGRETLRRFLRLV